MQTDERTYHPAATFKGCDALLPIPGYESAMSLDVPGSAFIADPFDLDAIEARAQAWIDMPLGVGSANEAVRSLGETAADVWPLLSEVRRLRDALREAQAR